MSEPARQLQQVGEATRAMRGVADQALEWVRVSEGRVAEAEKRADAVRDQVKERAMLMLRKVSAEAREKIAAERTARTEAESRIAAAEAGRDPAERGVGGFEERAPERRQRIRGQTPHARAPAHERDAE